jgi:hypothetical protein
LVNFLNAGLNFIQGGLHGHYTPFSHHDHAYHGGHMPEAELVKLEGPPGLFQPHCLSVKSAPPNQAAAAAAAAGGKSSVASPDTQLLPVRRQKTTQRKQLRQQSQHLQ